MDTSRMSRYDWVVVGGTIVFFFALFLAWFRLVIPEQMLNALSRGLGVSGNDISGLSQNGWHYASAVIAWLLMLLAAALVVVKGVENLRFSFPLPEGIVVMALGIVAFVLVFFRLVFVPAHAFDRAGGIYLALIATAAVAVGGFLKNAETS